jgi:Flp pilus assembly protein TadD
VEAAEGVLRAALTPDPTNAELWSALGVVLERAGREAEALACFERALALHPGHRHAGHNRAGLLTRQDPVAGLAAWEDVARADPTDLVARHNLGCLHRDAGRLAPAEAHLRAALAIDPSVAAAHLNLADVLLRQGRTEEARAELALARRDP